MLPGITREQQFIILGLVLVLLVGGGVSIYRKQLDHPPVVEKRLEPPLPMVNNLAVRQMVVQIGGGVVQEGVYQVKEGTRLAELITLAGGANVQADLSALNLAEVLKDGQKIILPLNQSVAGQLVGARGKKVNINKASMAELTALSGIGEATAKKIVEYRQKQGPFSQPADLLKIPRFGKARLETIKDQISVN